LNKLIQSKNEESAPFKFSQKRKEIINFLNEEKKIAEEFEMKKNIVKLQEKEDWLIFLC